MKDITILTGYLSNNTSGNRRIVYWVNYLSSLGYNVNIITSDHFLDNSINLELPSNIEIFKLGFLSLKKVNRDQLNETTITNIPNKSKLLWLQKVKRNLITKYLGQAFDIRIFYCFPLFFSLVKARFNSGELKFLNKQPRIVISSCPPYYTHIWNLLIKAFFKIKIVADYRDQFSENMVYTQRFSYLEKYMDKVICKKADMVITISGPMNEYYKKWNENTYAIVNGYDEKKYLNVIYNTFSIDGINTISYFGSIANTTRVPFPILDYLLSLDTQLDIKFNFYGDCDFLKDIIDADYKKITDYFYFYGQIKADEALEKMKISDVNLILEKLDATSLSELGTLPTKGFEFIAASRPIIAVCSPQSELGDFLLKSGLLLGIITTKEDAATEFGKYKMPNSFQPNEKFIRSFSRLESAKKFEKLLCDI
jgi:hypothetical protein